MTFIYVIISTFTLRNFFEANKISMRTAEHNLCMPMYDQAVGSVLNEPRVRVQHQYVLLLIQSLLYIK